MTDHRIDLCICGFPRWRHPKNEEDRKAISYTTSSTDQPHHLFIEPETDIRGVPAFAEWSVGSPR